MPPRSSKRLKQTANGKEKENVPVTTTSRRRSMKKAGNPPNTTLADLPFDTLLEVAGHLHPLDVYNLAHVNKTLYDALMSKSSIGAWRSARTNLAGFPAPLEGISEPAWVHLVYVKICHFCWVKTVKAPDFHLRCRVCPSCAHDNLIGYNPAVGAHPEDKEKIRQIFAIIPTHYAGYQGLKEKTQFALLSEYNAAEQHMAVDWEAYAQECSGRQAKIKAHAIICEKWREQCVSQREADLREMKKNRKTAIYNKLIELGYEDDLKHMKAFDTMYQEFLRHPRVKGTNVLTTRAWNNIQDEMITFAGTRSVLCHWLKQPNRVSPTKLYPSLPDFCSFKEIMPYWINQMTSSLGVKTYSKRLGKVVTGQDNLHPDAAIQAAKLARNVLICCRCCSFPDPGDQRHWNKWRKNGWTITVAPLFYPESLTHKCCSSGYLSTYDNGITMPSDDAMKLSSINERFGSSNFGRMKWSAGVLRKQEVVTTIVRRVIRLAGLDPKTATVDDMDNRHQLFECKWCPMETGSDAEDSEDDSEEEDEKLPDRLFYNWRLYVEHVSRHHYFDYEDMKSHVEVIGGHEDDELPDGYRVGDTMNTKRMYECIHCRCRPSEMLHGWPGSMAVISHITSNHAVEDPEEDVDYCLKFGQPDSPRQERVYLFDDAQSRINEACASIAATSALMIQMVTLAMLSRI
ncbi:hypothetical protein BDZ89DRAFT_1079840 [Hymenopellis radicata]|nr:hypothetical protein BDZ89DRAFT_1079840 [Hymenopellis radicata]